MSDLPAARPFVRILKTVADHYKVDADMLIAPRDEHYRSRRLNEPRRVAMFLIRELTAASYPEIGRFFHRDHTTVIYACRTAAEETSPTDLAALRAILNNEPVAGCHRCKQLMVELAALKVELLEMRARFNGCG